VTDFQLQDMTGIQLAERILEENPRTNVLIMSGSFETEDLAIEKGYHFLAKPFVPATLKERVLRILGSRTSAQSG
jgi:CheY-like chemotaxis protein